MTLARRVSAVAVVALAASVGVCAPSGAATTRTVAPAAVQHAVKAVAFKGHYTGTLTVLIVNNTSSASATVSSVKGVGTGTNLGKVSTLVGKGTVPTTSTNSGFKFNGSGTLAGGGSTLVLKVASSSASAPDGPGTVTLSGTATVTSGTGKWKGAKGTLKFSGSFKITGVASGSQTPKFTSALSGTLTA